MNKTIRNNLWAVAIAWILFLNGFALAGVAVLGLLDYVLLSRSNVNFWRAVSTTLICFVLSYLAYAYSTINYYFPGLFHFLIAVSLNVAAMGEYAKRASGNSLFKASCYTMAIMIAFYLIAIFLPDAWYSIFTKANLYLLVSLVFLPHASMLIIKSFAYEYSLSKSELKKA